ncbi:MAG: HigA family addiction module antitoxin [Desulfobacterales bacterium]
MIVLVNGVFVLTTNGASVSTLEMETLMTLKLSIITRGENIMVKNGLPAIHPGEFLAEIIGEMGISQAEFARAIGVSPMRISHVIKGDRPVTAELALLIGRAFNQSPQYWLNLQASYDLKIAEISIGKRLTSVHSFTHA